MTPKIGKCVPWGAKWLLVENHWILEMLRILSELIATMEAVQVCKQRYSVNVENRTSFSSLNNIFFPRLWGFFPFIFERGEFFFVLFWTLENIEGGTSYISNERIWGTACCEQGVGLGDLENALFFFLAWIFKEAKVWIRIALFNLSSWRQLLKYYNTW